MRNTIADNSMFTARVKKERDMKREMQKIVKTGFIATGTLAAAGMAFGMSPVAVHAAEMDTDAPEASVQSSTEVSAPETLEDARNALDAAQEEVETSDAAVSEAESRVSEAQTAFDTASEEADTARSDAETAFEEARSEAARADAAAQDDVADAERDVAEAEGKAQQAGEEADSAEESFREAENSVQEAMSENPVTESDISDKEAELADAETDLEEAEKTYEEAETARSKAADEAQQKEDARNDAKDTVKEAEAAKAENDAAAASAEDEAGQANKELQTAEDLKNGVLDIKDTVQYKEEQAAKETKEKAAEAAEIAAQDTDKAALDLEKAGAAVDAAEKKLDQASEKLNNRESELSEAEKTKKAADTGREKAQKTYDKAAAEAAGADAAVSDAEKAMTEAKDDVTATEAAKKTADNAVKKAADAVAAARKEAEAAADADIAAAEKDAAEKRSAVESAQKALDAADEKYKQGTLGLIDWMLKKNDLTDEQVRDLTDARTVLEKASEEDFNKWVGGDDTGLPEERGGKVVVIGDEKDATNLENLFKSIEIMKKINELRATDDNFTGDMQRSDSYTNFFFMATAEAGAMRGAGLRRHSSLTTSCENLAFGFSDPTVGWYDREKAVFDRIKGELGITEITSWDDVQRIEEEAERRGAEVGHYTNLFWAADQVMGVGYTQYRSTSCYNASKASNYTTNRYNRASHVYTLSEFEKLSEEYYQTVDKSSYEDALKSANTEQSEAERRLQDLIDNKDTAVASAIKDENAVLESKKSDALAAAQTLTDARSGLADAEKASQEAQAVKLSSDQALQAALTALEKASDKSRTADAGVASAEKARDDAKKSVTEAGSALQDAIADKNSAASALKDKKNALTDANNALRDAAALHAAAEKKLAALTSDDTLEALREQKRAADTALESALAKKGVTDEAFKQAKAALAQAETEASGAKTALREADTRFAEAAGARDSAKSAADQAALELAALREQYAPILRATAARDAAKENLDRAKAILKGAKSDLAKAGKELDRAQKAKEMTADKLVRATGLSVEAALLADIEDPDFTYLNEYVSALKAADMKLSSARKSLDDANTELASRKTDSENAQKAYTEALADFEIARIRTEMSAVNPDPVPEQTLPVETVETADYREAGASTVTGITSDAGAVTLDAGGKDSGETVRKVKQKTSDSTSVGTAAVATGDTSNVMGWLAGLLAGTVLMFLVSRRKKEEKDRSAE